ncbi:alpha-ketoacid dehydrogenase subunit beta [Mycolicibacterium komossense]|uniref:Alpha-ketoacid dehydrogenase subunit beta n=1 Tax=Mycolicibacterium komossense TaxID=1779 RepID=A0ABT3CF11_9MYCO|nr:alpha-ketoacid dehydrogenase subunit beta [Mycolicibacterium komossense]MCV7228075.1 alpha-ketoacid dehydrogenase subunit beta [Mycolicibacterium komossense]
MTTTTDTPASVTTTLGKALNTGMRQAMRDDDSVVLLGEDIGALGGVFRVTEDLQAEFGPNRVFDTPLAESGIVGTAIGLALRGYRPVCEIQFDGFIYPAFDQIVSQLAKMRARSGGRLTMPVTIRVPCGGGIGAVEHHSESNESYFCHTAGLRVVACANPADAHWMIQQAIACDDPVIFYEPKRRYWDKAEVAIGPVPPDAPALDSARVAKAGNDVTVIAYGPTVRVALDAATVAQSEGRSLEVIDLRSLSPLDMRTITASVRRTRRAIVVHEAPTFVGLGAEIAAAITQECFPVLEAPVLRVGGWNVPYPPARTEQLYLPDIDRVLDAVDSVAQY